MNFKQAITALGYSVCYSDDEASSKGEKELLHDFRGKLKLSFEEYQEFAYKSDSFLLDAAKSMDPLSKCIANQLMLKIARLEKEDDPSNNISDSEWATILKFRKAMFDPIGIDAKKIDAATYLLFINISTGIESSKTEIANFETDYFSQLENNPSVWLSEYYKLNDALIDWAGIDDQFIFLCESLESKVPKIKRLAESQIKIKEKEEEAARKAREKEEAAARKAREKEEAAARKAREKEEEAAKKAATHEYSFSNGIQYCRHCGKDGSWSRLDCHRENGHRFTVKKVNGVYEPVCSKCGHDSSWGNLSCS